LLFSLVIILNAIYIGVETEIKTEEKQEFPDGWWYAESSFLVVFVIELVLRLVSQSLRNFFRDGWNDFDFLLVASGVVDSWILTPIMSDCNGQETQDAACELKFSVDFLLLLKVLRLVRVFRLLRLVRFLSELLILLKGIVGAMRALVWSAILMLLLVYVCAIFGTKVFGQAEESSLETHTYGDMQRYFGTLLKSMFTLLQVVTLEGWPEIARKTMKSDILPEGVVMILFIGFVMFSNFMLLNLVTGVILDHVMTISREEERGRSAKLEMQRANALLRLEHLFHEMDFNEDGELTLEELRNGLDGNEAVRKELHKLEVGILDIDELFHLLDFDGNGAISVHEFVDGAMRAVGPASAKHLLGLHFDLHQMWTHLLETIETLQPELAEPMLVAAQRNSEQYSSMACHDSFQLEACSEVQAGARGLGEVEMGSLELSGEPGGKFQKGSQPLCNGTGGHGDAGGGLDDADVGAQFSNGSSPERSFAPDSPPTMPRQGSPLLCGAAEPGAGSRSSGAGAGALHPAVKLFEERIAASEARLAKEFDRRWDAVEKRVEGILEELDPRHSQKSSSPGSAAEARALHSI